MTRMPPKLDLFGQNTISLNFYSGASTRADFNGLQRAGVPIGVSVPYLSKPMQNELIDALDDGVHVFIDSGAFSELNGAAVDFGKVMGTYLEIATATQHKDRLHIVAPDKVGDASESIERLGAWRHEVLGLIDMGVDVLVPLQLGGDSLASHWREVVRVLGTDNFRLSIPSNASAVSPKDLDDLMGEVTPRRVHLLGIGSRETKIQAMVDLISRHHPDMDITCDSVRFRAWTDKMPVVREAVLDDVIVESRNHAGAILNQWAWDDTEIFAQDNEDELKKMLAAEYGQWIYDLESLADLPPVAWMEIENKRAREDLDGYLASNRSAKGEVRSEVVFRLASVGRLNAMPALL